MAASHQQRQLRGQIPFDHEGSSRTADYRYADGVLTVTCEFGQQSRAIGVRGDVRGHAESMLQMILARHSAK